MKRVAIFSAVLAMGGLCGSAVQAADGTINFRGALTASPCSIDGANSNQTIDFGVVSTATFSDIGSVGPSKPFKIELTGCDTSTKTKAAVRFDGTAASSGTTTGLLSTDNDGLAIELTDPAGTRVALGTISSYVDLLPSSSRPGTGTPPPPPISNNDGSGVLSFRARYSALKKFSDLRPGPANATASFTIAYQ